MAVDLFEKLVAQARQLGITHIGLTGGEATLHPALPALLQMIADASIKFSIVTNGTQFGARLLPVLLNTSIHEHLDVVCVSVDGSDAKTHDSLRGDGSFRQAIAALALAQRKGISTSVKTCVTNFNKAQLLDIALIGAALGVSQHSFIALVPTPTALDARIMPAPDEMLHLHAEVRASIAPVVRSNVVLEGSWGMEPALFECNAYQQMYNVDHLGKVVFCCNLARVREDGREATLGREVVGDLASGTLAQGVAGHHRLLAEFTQARLAPGATGDTYYARPCWWCLRYFDKLDWIDSRTVL